MSVPDFVEQPKDIGSARGVWTNADWLVDWAETTGTTGTTETTGTGFVSACDEVVCVKTALGFNKKKKRTRPSAAQMAHKSPPHVSHWRADGIVL